MASRTLNVEFGLVVEIPRFPARVLTWIIFEEGRSMFLL